MNGAVIPNTPIAVDFWRVRRCPHSRIFFLSHMHADHTAGLTSSWNSYTIYCSAITKKLLTAKLHVKSELVVGLPLYEPVTINLDEVGRETMTVTLVDANHCPGSVMFIFEGYFGRILYTGDFRFCDRLLKYSAIKGKQFDTLYLDNTYCHPKCFFPTRSNATNTVVEIIRNHPQHTVVIGLHSLGKETLLYDIAVACKCWIGMDPSRSETMELVGMPQVFTCDVDSTRIRVVSFQEVNKRNIDLWNSKEPTIAILPTCLYVGGSNPYENVPNVFVVPYSDHSSFEELKAFVSDIRPRKIIPIVHKHRLLADENPNSRVNMNIFQSLMEPSSSQKFSVPPSVECFMAPEMKQDVKKRMKATTKLGIRKVAKSRKACGVVFLPSQEECEEQKFCGWANLPLYEPVTINLDEVGRETMTVTLVDANHCPGSVMFIFEGYFGRILYTGDFRFCDRLLKYSAIKGKQFDTLYLDNTYCHPKCFFPTRSNATNTVVEIIRNHPQHTVVIGLHSLGKETLLYEIAVACKCWIGMDPSRSETMELVGMPQVFTCDVDSTRIRVVSFQEVNKRNIDLWNSKEPTIAILPTCLYVGGSNPYENVPNVFVVPYSDHSSFEELKAFVSDIRPRKIIPIVHKHRLLADENPNSRVNMNIFQSLMEPSSSQKFSVPPSVECFMAPEMKQDVKKRMKATTKLGIRKVAKSRKACGVVFLPSQEECEEQKFCGWANGNFEGKENTDSERGDCVAEEIDIQGRHDSMISPMKNDREPGSGVVVVDNKGVAINDNSRDKVGSVYFILKEGFEVNENIREFSNEQMLEESNMRESSLAFFGFKQVNGSREKEGDRIDKDEEMLNEISSKCTTFADLKGVCSGTKRIENDIAGIEDTHDDGYAVGSSFVQRGHAEKRRRIDEEGTDCKDATKAEELRSTETSLIKQCSFVMDEAIKECHNDFVSGAEENKENNGRCAFASPSVRNTSGFSENEKNVVKPEETNIFSSMRTDSCSSKKRRVGDQDGVEKVETDNAQEEHKVDSSPMQGDHVRKRAKMDNDDKDITIAGDSDGEGNKHSDLDDQVDDFGCDNETSDDELFAVGSCYQRGYASRVCQQDERITSIEKSFSDNQGSKKKRFNMYTGQTCDFARKLLKDMVRNGSL
ncbi:PREDICTED: uncharacterized protein LOC107352051 [Acropora digitifera]|uniref:uncharacterized protein LOC107352051 n=1 Tax=Acropora digitifera TaxID=70779 RepID=UPI00077A0756|nr:PREDICTED: uncharacterized protein LOC107352051 [Acropora digitifera]